MGVWDGRFLLDVGSWTAGLGVHLLFVRKGAVVVERKDAQSGWSDGVERELPTVCWVGVGDDGG